MLRFHRWASLTLAALTAGCSSAVAPVDKLACPSVDLVPSLTKVAQFKPGGGHDIADVQIAAEMTGITRLCHHEAKGIGVDVHVSMTAIRANPKIPQTKLTYFVAVVDSQRDILQEQDFDVEVSFLPAQAYRLYTDPITVHIPTRDPAHTDDHILVGFRLSREQLDFNRGHTQKQ